MSSEICQLFSFGLSVCKMIYHGYILELLYTWKVCKLYLTCVYQCSIVIRYFPQWAVPPSIQIMVCRLLGAKPLSKPLLVYKEIDPWDKAQRKLDELYGILYKKMHLKMSSAMSWPFWPGFTVLKIYIGNTFLNCRTQEKLANSIWFPDIYVRSQSAICLSKLGHHRFG